MVNETLHTLLRHLHRVVDPVGLGGLPDGQLLDRFRAGRDEAAFEVLVWRHGPMVLNLCRRLLRDEQDAEDVFQAAFLVLVRKAGSIHKDGSVGSWLYKVAYRAALEARARSARRPEALPPDAEPAAPAEEDAAWRELRPVLDEEVHRLPEKYREPFVLCYLEGQTTDEAAKVLQCPRGTVATRLAWARRRLRDRLVRRGVALSAAALTAALAPGAGTAAPRLLSSTIRAGLSPEAVPGPVLSLAEGVMHAMFLSKVKTAAAVVVAFVALATGGVAIGVGGAEGRPAGPADERRDEPRKDGDRKAEQARDGDVRRPTRVAGEVKSVDAAKLTLTAVVQERDGDEPTAKTYTVSPDYSVLLTGRQAELTDLKPGMRTTLQFSRDGRKVILITVVERRGGERRDGDRRPPERREGDAPGKGRGIVPDRD